MKNISQLIRGLLPLNKSEKLIQQISRRLKQKQ